MNKFVTVLKHTFLTNAKSKTFKRTTVIMSLLIVVVFSLPNLLNYFDKEEIKKIGVLDTSEEIGILLEQQLVDLGYTDIRLVEVNSEENAEQKVIDDELEGYLIINLIDEGDNKGNISAIYKAPQVNNSGLINKLEQGLNQIQFRYKASALGITVEEAGKLFEPVSIEKNALDENAKSEEEIIQSTVLVYILLFAIYFGVLMYGNLVASEIAKEKSSRVMEILVSSVNPITQMFGKIIGIALLGLFQASIFVLVGYITMIYGDKSIDFGGLNIDFSNIPSETIVAAIIFFLLGYLLYATFAAMLGSLVSKMEDLQQTITPLNFIVIIAFMIAMYGLNNPDSSFIIITSYIPFFTPMIMFLRVGITSPSIWEVLISFGLMIVTIILVAILAAKTYRGGVIMYGKGTSLKSIKKAIRINDN